MALSFMRFSSWFAHCSLFSISISKFVFIWGEFCSDYIYTHIICRKSKRAISAAFHVHRQKPSFCNLSVLCGGKQVFLREENNEGVIEDEQGFLIAKLREKISFRGWLGKMFPENGKNHCDSPSSSATTSSPNQWDKYSEEIDHYFNQLLFKSNTKEDSESADDKLVTDFQRELNLPENMVKDQTFLYKNLVLEVDLLGLVLPKREGLHLLFDFITLMWEAYVKRFINKVCIFFDF